MKTEEDLCVKCVIAIILLGFVTPVCSMKLKLVEFVCFDRNSEACNKQTKCFLYFFTQFELRAAKRFWKLFLKKNSNKW